MERTPLVSFVIPVGTYHREIAERAVGAVLAQTVTSHAIVVYDNDGRGAGWARNRGLEQVRSPFVVFLDSDDLIEPAFAERTLLAYDGRRYVYTDWFENGHVAAPPCAWAQGRWHVITTLLPTGFVRYVGGFDETFTVGEDSDFYTKLTRAGLCGKHLPEPLFHYCKGGERTKALFEDGVQSDPPIFSAAYHEFKRILTERYGGLFMPCCGDIPNLEELPAGTSTPGDVLATSLWAGNRQERGRASGRLYPRSGHGKRLWVNPADIDAAPHLFARVVEMPAPIDDAGLQAFRQFAGDMRQALGVNGRDVSQTPAPAYAVPGEVVPDVGRVLRLYQQNVAHEAE